MAARLNLGSAIPGADVLQDLYTVPDEKATAVSTLHVCNQGSADATFDVARAPEGEADDEDHYLYYQEPIRARRAFAITVGLGLDAGDVLRVRSSNGAVSFNLSGEEEDA